MNIRKTKLEPISLLRDKAWFYEERGFLDVYVHSDPGNIINFRITKKSILDWLKRVGK